MSRLNLDPQMTECIDILVTLELAVKFAQCHPNNAIRSSWSIIRRRVTHDRNRRVFDGLSAQVLPLGGLKLLTRKFKEILG